MAHPFLFDTCLSTRLGDALVLPGTWFSIELSATTPVREWGGKDLWVGAEEDAVIDEAGRASWVLKRQTEYHLVK